MSYATEAAFRAALNARISAEARKRHWTRDDVARAVALQVFTARLFRSPDAARWILTGGTALQFRAPTQARPTSDADLATAVAGDELQQALRHATEPRPGEYGKFTITITPSKTPGLYTGAIQYLVDGKRTAAATLDLSHREPMFAPDEVIPTPVVDVDGLTPLPPVRINSVPDALADKVAAMYELHGKDATTPSTRYHDLVDLLIITGTEPIDATQLRAALDEQQRRRAITIPDPLTLPDKRWASEYPKPAQRSGLPAHLHNPAAALHAANTCLHPLLSGETPDGAVWDPRNQRWTLPTPTRPTDRPTITRLLDATRPPQATRPATPAHDNTPPQQPADPHRDLAPGLDP